jgi:capsular exopolysaccharide synthesis family protein
MTLEAFDTAAPSPVQPVGVGALSTPRSAGDAILRLGTPQAASKGLAGCADNERLVLSPKMGRVAVQQYRKLASTLHQLQIERGLRSLVVTSAVAGEGKTITAANLALTLSESFRRRVLLIDADLRRPMIDKVFRMRNPQGLSSTLASNEPVARVTALSDRLAVLSGGRPDHDPLSALSSDRMKLLLEDAVASFDWVIIDTPPVTVFSDAGLLSMTADGVLLVVRACSTPVSLIQRAITTVTPERVVGTVLNQTEDVTMQEYGYGAEAYDDDSPEGDGNASRMSLTEVPRVG